jgi:hypothetical protein
VAPLDTENKNRVARIIDDYGKAEAAAEQDRTRRAQLEKAAEFFGGNLSSSLDF